MQIVFNKLELNNNSNSPILFFRYYTVDNRPFVQYARINNKSKQAHDVKMFKLRNSKPMERFVVELFVSYR